MSTWQFIPQPHPLVEAVPAFDDNYLWLILGPEISGSQGRTVAVVDPGDAQAINIRLRANNYKLGAILITHHHPDHIGGLKALKEQWQCPVYGPLDERIEGIDHVLDAGEVEVAAISTRFQVIEVPGHTLTHISYYAKRVGLASEAPGVLFCGDTLFAAGCGRLFEGTPSQMQGSLASLASLPAETLVFCAHEYTLSNLKFAQAALPHSQTIYARLEEAKQARAQGVFTVPSSIQIERATNPFLLAQETAMDASLVTAGQLARPLDTAPEAGLERFTALRAWKNVFK